MATKTKAKTKTNVLNVAIVWDMSGSMGSIVGATKEGIQGYLMDLISEEKKLIEEKGEGVYTRLSVTAFDTVFERWVENEPILDIDVAKIIDQYGPRGGTALYDAIANTITDLSARIGERKEAVLMVVMTDGQENSSREYAVQAGGRERLFDLIKRQEKKGWTFVYLGANVDAYTEASAIGIPTGNTAYYSATTDSVAVASASMTPVTRAYRMGATGPSGPKGTSTAFGDAGQKQDFREEEDKS